MKPPHIKLIQRRKTVICVCFKKTNKHLFVLLCRHRTDIIASAVLFTVKTFPNTRIDDIKKVLVSVFASIIFVLYLKDENVRDREKWTV